MNSLLVPIVVILAVITGIVWGKVENYNNDIYK